MRVAESGWDFYTEYWRPAQLVVSDMERVGFPVDVDRCYRGAEETRALIAPLEEKLNHWAGQPVNWNSPKQVAKLLYHAKGFEAPRVGGTLGAVKILDEGKESTSAASIEYLADHVPDLDDRRMLRVLREYSTETKNLQFWEKLPKHLASDGRIHCCLGATTETGRLSSSNPNLQNIPTRTATGARLREAFIAGSGFKLVVIDYSGLEWRILAHCLMKMYGDSSLVDEIVAGIDPHSATAVKMGLCPGPVELVKKLYPGERGSGKILNYSINYGKTGAGLGVQIRDKDGEPIGTKAGDALLEGFFVARPGVKRFQDDMIRYARATGQVLSLLGRPRKITLPLTRWDKYKRKEVPASGGRQALNVIQNCATDIVTLAMLRCHPVLHPELHSWISGARRELARLGAEQVLQIHDELVFRVPEQNAERVKDVASEQMVKALEGVRDFLCPLEAEGGIGDNWREAKGK